MLFFVQVTSYKIKNRAEKFLHGHHMPSELRRKCRSFWYTSDTLQMLDRKFKVFTAGMENLKHILKEHYHEIFIFYRASLRLFLH